MWGRKEGTHLAAGDDDIIDVSIAAVLQPLASHAQIRVESQLHNCSTVGCELHHVAVVG